MEDEDDVVIQPRRSSKESPIPETGLFLVNPSEARYGLKAAEGFGASPRRFYNSDLCVNTSRGYFVAGPAIGAPLAVMVLEKLIALGARRVVLFGWCGSMTEALPVGSLLIPTSCKSGEGTSSYYVSEFQPSPSPRLVDSLRRHLRGQNLTWAEGCVWSTDAPYREKRSQLNELRQKNGVCAVDMECSALCSAAFFRTIDVAALLLVSDEVWGRSWKPGFSGKEFKSRSRLLIDLFLQRLPLLSDDENNSYHQSRLS